MASFTLKLGNLDLSNYTRVAQGEGLDPLDGSGFLDPQFSDSAVAEGAPLVYVSQGNREMAFPLYLKAASKDALATLLQQVNWEIEFTKPLTIEWKDQGASASTFYDVTFARFDPDYNFRRAGQNWLGGVLHVWAQPPYGHTGTMRIIATGVASGSALRIPIPSAIQGDVDAQLNVKIQQGGANSWEGDQIGVSVLPNPNWQPIIGASSFYNALVGSNSYFQATIGLASQAPGGVAYNVKIDQTYYQLANHETNRYHQSQDAAFGFALGASQYYGNMRVLAAVRSASRRGIGMQLLNESGDPVANMTTATGWRGFSLIDLGRISMPSNIDGATKTWFVRIDSAPLLEDQKPPSIINNRVTDDPFAAQIAQLYVLPEDKTQLYLDSQRQPHTAFNIYGNNTTFSPLTNTYPTSFTDLYGNTWAATKAVVLQDGFGQYNKAISVASGSTDYQLYTTTEGINDIEFEAEYDGYLFTGVASALSAIVIRRNLQVTYAVFSVGANASGQLYLTGYNANALGFNSLASKAFAPPASPSGTLLLRVRKQGPVVNMMAEWYAYANGSGGIASYAVLATLAASGPLFQSTGEGIFISNRNATAGISNMEMPMYSFRSHALPSFGSIATGVFEIDSARRISQYKTTTGSYQREMVGQRGSFQGLPAPSPAAVFVVHQGIDSPSDITSAVVSVRERFTYVR